MMHGVPEVSCVLRGGIVSDTKILLQAPQVGISTYNGSLALESPSRDIIQLAVPEEVS